MRAGASAARDPGALASGDRVGGRYRITRPLASGGFGAVYEATHLHTQRVVALKLLHEQVALDEVARERFEREASAAAHIGHPGIVQVLDAGFEPDGTPFVAMEMLPGETLRDALARGDHGLVETLGLFDRILDALAAAHAAGFVHRDLKPENVFVLPGPVGAREVRILDFGLARRQGSKSVTATGTALGTPRYMSPEQYMSAKDVAPAADVWAIGVMLYEALSGGHAPFAPTATHALMLAILTEPHAPLDERAPLPAALARLVDRCLAKEPGARPADAGVLRRELSAIGGSLGADDLATVKEMPRFAPLETPAPRAAEAPTQVAAPQDMLRASRSSTPARLLIVAAISFVVILGLGVGAGVLLFARRPSASNAVAPAPPPSSPAPLGPAMEPVPMLPNTPPPSAPAPSPAAARPASRRAVSRTPAQGEPEPEEGEGADRSPEPPDPTSPLEPLFRQLPLP